MLIYIQLLTRLFCLMYLESEYTAESTSHTESFAKMNGKRQVESRATNETIKTESAEDKSI